MAHGPRPMADSRPEPQALSKRWATTTMAQWPMALKPERAPRGHAETPMGARATDNPARGEGHSQQDDPIARQADGGSGGDKGGAESGVSHRQRDSDTRGRQMPDRELQQRRRGSPNRACAFLVFGPLHNPRSRGWTIDRAICRGGSQDLRPSASGALGAPNGRG